MKHRTRRVIIMLGVACSTIAMCVVFGFLDKNDEDVIINRIVGIVAIVSGLGSLLVGISSIFSTSLDNVREYYATGDAPEFAQARRTLYNYRYIKIKYGKSIYDNDFDQWAEGVSELSEGTILKTNRSEIISAASLVTNFFQMWGLLQYKGFLPIWVFETASGYSIIKLYEAVEDILNYRYETNPFYGAQFRGLCSRINAKYKKSIYQCRVKEKEYIQHQFQIDDPEESGCFGADNFLKTGIH